MPNDEFQPNHRVLNAFIKWIEQDVFDPQHAKNWARLYKANPEAAMCEATFWAVLTDCGVEVEPNADLTGGARAPDFLCKKNGTRFYVEVTCIQIDTATRATGLDPLPDSSRRAQPYRHLNDAIFNECRNKTPQCADSDAPCLLAVGTFHFQASVLGVRKMFMEWLLTGECGLCQAFDPELGQCVGEPYQATSFRSAAFTRWTRLETITHGRNPISALLVGGFGCDPPRLFGLLNPNPIHGFDARILTRIPFCRQRIDLQAGRVSTEWTQTPDDWEDD